MYSYTALAFVALLLAVQTTAAPSALLNTTTGAQNRGGSGNLGYIEAISHCPHPVWYKTSGVGFQTGYSMLSTSQPTRFEFGTSVSVKLCLDNKVQPEGSISQLEFNHEPAAGKVWYDISNVDAYRLTQAPFVKGGLRLTPVGKSDSRFPNCKGVTCKSGQPVCDGAYLNPNDKMTLDCSEKTSLELVLCPRN